jgi:hypothetical protein
MARRKAVYFVGNGGEQEFSEFLRREKDLRGIDSWNEFSKFLGVVRSDRYCKGNQPISPGESTLYSIAEVLGYKNEDFIIESPPPWPLERELLEGVAEAAIASGATDLSTYDVRKVSESLYAKCKRELGMDGLIARINEVVPGHGFTYTPQLQRETPNVPLADKERSIILGALGGVDMWEGKLPRGTYHEIGRRLKCCGYERSRDSLVYHVGVIRNGK